MSDINITVDDSGGTNVTVANAETSNVSVSSIASGTAVTFDPSTTDLTSSTVSGALEELANEGFVQTGTPSSGVSEGDTWYDNDDDVYYIRDENSWNEVLVDGASSLNGGTFT